MLPLFPLGYHPELTKIKIELMSLLYVISRKSYRPSTWRRTRCILAQLCQCDRRTKNREIIAILLSNDSYLSIATNGVVCAQ